MSEVFLTRQRVNLVTYLIVCLVALPVYLPIAFAGRVLFNFSIVSVLLACYAVVPIGLLVGLSTKWVRVTFPPELGEPSEAYFADGKSHGWHGIFGGTAEIFRTVKAEILRSGPK